MIRRSAPILVLLASLAYPASAQVTSTLPGMTTAFLPLSASSRSFSLGLSAAKIGANEIRGDILAGRMRMSLSQSWRVLSQAEIGFGFTLGNATLYRESGLLEGEDGSTRYTAHLGYGLRFGLKVRPISSISPDGYGFAVALALVHQPSLLPLLDLSNVQDSTVTGGYLGADAKDGGIAHEVHSATRFGGVASYRGHRFEVDGGLVYDWSDPNPNAFLDQHEGFSATLTSKVRLTRGFGVGLVFWGSGRPSWADRVHFNFADEGRPDLAFLFTFGDNPESSTDILVSSPTGSLGESVALVISVR